MAKGRAKKADVEKQVDVGQGVEQARIHGLVPRHSTITIAFPYVEGFKGLREAPVDDEWRYGPLRMLVGRWGIGGHGHIIEGAAKGRLGYIPYAIATFYQDGTDSPWHPAIGRVLQATGIDRFLAAHAAKGYPAYVTVTDHDESGNPIHHVLTVDHSGTISKPKRIDESKLANADNELKHLLGFHHLADPAHSVQVVLPLLSRRGQPLHYMQYRPMLEEIGRMFPASGSPVGVSKLKIPQGTYKPTKPSSQDLRYQEAIGFKTYGFAPPNPVLYPAKVLSLGKIVDTKNPEHVKELLWHLGKWHGNVGEHPVLRVSHPEGVYGVPTVKHGHILVPEHHGMPDIAKFEPKRHLGDVSDLFSNLNAHLFHLE